jgi:hypothetical protein
LASLEDLIKKTLVKKCYFDKYFDTHNPYKFRIETEKDGLMDGESVMDVSHCTICMTKIPVYANLKAKQRNKR